jgi:hypothetical protein
MTLRPDTTTPSAPEVQVLADRIIVVAPTPWRLHRGLLRVAGVAGLMLVLGGGMLLPLVLMTDVLPGVSDALRPVLDEPAFWIFVALGVLLLVLDRRSRRRTEWRRAGVRTSWLFGPLDLFPRDFSHAELPPLEVIHYPVPRLLAWLLGGEGGDWVVGWRHDRGDGRPSQLREIARLPDPADAERLRERLSGAFGADPPASARASVPALGVAEIASLGLNRLLWWPIALLVGFALVPISLMVDAIAVRQGLRAPTLPWDAVAEARLERLAWRVTQRMKDVQHAGRRVSVPEYGARLHAQVSFIDRDGVRQVRPLGLALPGSGDHLASHGMGPAYVIERAAEAGLRLQPVVFELPRSVLAAGLDADGALRLDQVDTDPSAAVMTPEFVRHWTLVVHLDRPSVYLPLRWSEPSLPGSFPIVHRVDAPPGSAVWPQAVARDFEPRLVDYDGLLFGLGGIAFVLGGFAFAWLLPRRHRRWLALPAWVLVCASSLYWDRLSDRAAGWLGIDRGLAVRLRDALAHRVLPSPGRLAALDDAVVVGHWSPQRSRHRELLDLMGLLEPPPTLQPDFAAARAAIEQHGRARLARLSFEDRDRLLDLDPQLILPRGGDTWLLRAVIAPEVCAWTRDPEGAARSRWNPASIASAYDCPEAGD